ncbi:hypothetical protein [Pseudomonas sp. Pseu.R1]|uniref:hypothetical protein n=1 Tax=Pseudomonas sp. Pseu.R1 TaxID=3379818 RepID=UPI003B9276E2
MTKHYIKTQPLTDSQIDILTHGPATSYYGDELQFMVKAGLMEMTLYGRKDFEREGFKGAQISRRFRPSARGIASLSVVAPERLPNAGLRDRVKMPPPKQEISCLALGLLLYSLDSSVMRYHMVDISQGALYCAKHDLIRMGLLHDPLFNNLSYEPDVVEYTPEGAAIISDIVQAASEDYGVDLAQTPEALSVLFLAAGGFQQDTVSTLDITAQQWKILEHHNFATITQSDGSHSSLKIHTPLVISWFEGISKPYPYTTLGQFNLKITEDQKIYPDVIAQFTVHNPNNGS